MISIEHSVAGFYVVKFVTSELGGEIWERTMLLAQ